MAVWHGARGGMILHVLSSLFGMEIIEFYKQTKNPVDSYKQTLE